MPVVLYDIKQRVTLIQRAADIFPVNYWDRSMDLDNADFRIYKGVDNKIEFLLRNTDRKAISLVGATIRIIFTDRMTGEVIADQTATVVDELKGMVALFLSKSVIESWPEGGLRYSALNVDVDGNEFLLFADQNQKATAFCYVMSSPIQTPVATSAQVYNFPLLKSNETHIRRIQLVKDGVGLDTTGYTFEMQIRISRIPGADILQDLTTDNSDISVITDTNGDVYLELRIGPITSITTRTTAYYDLVATKDADQTVWLEGTITFEPGVTL